MKFKLRSDFAPTGDQPQAIEKLAEGFLEGNQFETLLGVTGSGKTFTMANIIERVQKPTLIMSHNKTLAAQLYGEMKEFFPDNAVEYLAKNIQTNIRELEGKLNQLLLLSEMRGVPPDDLIAEGLIATPQEESKRRSISPKQVVDKVAKYYNLSSKDLYGTSRTKDIKSARQVAMYLMKDQLGLSTVKIGTEFKKDHTTIMHGIKVIETALKTDFNLRSQISDLREKIYAN